MQEVTVNTALALKKTNEIVRTLQEPDFRGHARFLGHSTGVLGRVTKQEVEPPKLLSFPYFPLLSLAPTTQSNDQVRT